MPMPYAAVIFDMDGLLLDTERVAQEARAEACAALGLDVPFDFFVTRLLGTDHATGTALLREFVGRDFDNDRLDQLWQAACDRRYAAGVPLRPDVHAMLDLVDNLPLPKAIATSTRTRRAWDKLDSAGLAHRFETLVGFDCVTAPKPAPDPYLLAAQRLGADPATCLAFEDSDTGTRSALAAGMTVVQVPDMLPATPGLAHFTAPSLLAGATLAGLT